MLQLVRPCLTFAAVLCHLPETGNFFVIAFTYTAVPQHTHAVIWPEATVTPEIDFEVAEEWCLNKACQDWV